MKDLDNPEFGKDNKIFTREQAIAARERLRERLRRMEPMLAMLINKGKQE